MKDRKKKLDKKPTPKVDSKGDAPKEKSKLGLIGKLVLPIVLGATSFCTVYFLPSDPALQVSETASPQNETNQKNAELQHVSVSTSFVTLEAFTVSLKGRTRILRLGITLEAPDTFIDTIDPNNPKLRDAFMGYLSVLDMKQVEDAAFLVGLRQQLTRRAKFVLGANAVQNVLITDFMVR